MKQTNESWTEEVELYSRKKVAYWLTRLLGRCINLSSNFFECLEWVGLDMRQFIRRLKRTAFVKANPSIIEELDENKNRRFLSSTLESLLEDYPDLKSTFIKIIRDMSGVSESEDAGNPFNSAWRKMRNLFGISQNACKICEFIFIKDNFDDVSSYLMRDLEICTFMKRHLLAYMLNLQTFELNYAIKELRICGCIDDDEYYNLSDNIAELWKCNGKVSPQSFIRIVKGETLPLSEFNLEPEVLNHICKLLLNPGKRPLHLLFYGEPGTGKSCLAASLAKHLNLKGFSVVSRNDDSDNDRRSSLIACAHRASLTPGSFVLVDEAERMLDTESYDNHQTKDKAWLNSFLEEPGRRIIWITNRVYHIDPAVRRRFTFSVYFGDLGEKGREHIWNTIIDRYNVRSRIPEGELKALISKYDVPAGVIKQAVEQSRSLVRGKKNFVSSICRVLDAYLLLCNNGRAIAPTVQNDEQYLLAGVNTKENIEKLIANFQKLDKKMTTLKEEQLPQGCGTVLFYGPPGTGKTALAGYIAKILRRECLTRKASDLLSKYVGESEQLVNEAFEEAKRRNAVLVIDEVDSFIYSRENTVRSWEVTLVNQFLTCLEKYKGICICTTNYRANLDSAAMRRFSYKIEFDYSGANQCKSLYNSLLAPIVGSPISGDAERELLNMRNLTPGDFHAVRSRHWLDETGDMTHSAFIAELRKEIDAKLENEAHKIGF